MDLRQRPSHANKNQENDDDSSSSSTDTNITGQLKRRKCRRRCLVIFQAFFLTLFLLYIIFPILLRFSPALQRNLIFLSSIKWPLFLDISRPDKLGLPGSRNFYLSTNSNIVLGVWQILPNNMEPLEFDADAVLFEDALKSGNPVFLYVHGNAGTRGGTHRIELYQILRMLNFHVIAFDYRGYADSSNISPSENGVVEDSKFVYNWIRQKVGNIPVFVWGHSLGTGVATKMAKELCDEGAPPDGIVLESPFNNLRDEVKHHPLSTPYKFFPFFDLLFLDSLERSNIIFASDKSIVNVTSPILILHAEDDNIIPFELGEKLYKIALEKRSPESGPVKFVTFNADRGYGHRYICRAPNLSQIVRTFIDECFSFLQKDDKTTSTPKI